MKTLKQKILDATDGGRLIFEDLYVDAQKIFANNGKGFIKLRDEHTASAAFKLLDSKDGKYWMLHDFGDDTSINAIDAYMREKGIMYFKEALLRLAAEYHVSNELDKKVNKARIKTRPANDDEHDKDVKWEEREITDKELEIMGPNVTREIMAAYNYKALAWYSTVKDRKVTTFYSNEDFPIFMHDCGDFQKIYKPFEVDKGYRFRQVGPKPIDYIYGLPEAKTEYDKRKRLMDDLLKNEEHPSKLSIQRAGETAKLVNEKLPEIIICSGERDAMCIAGLGYIPVWFNSESAKKSNEQIDQLFAIADKVYNIPDIDDAGVEKGKDLALAHISVFTIELPEWLKDFKDQRLRPCKDLRDYIELRPSKTEFDKLMKSAQRAKFWYKDGKKIQIQSLNLLYFLRLNGFYKYKDPISGEIKIVRLEKYKVQEFEPVQVRDFVRKALKNFQVGNDVLETYINSKKTTKQIYDDLESIDIDFNSSTPEGRMLFFENVCVFVKHNIPDKNNPDYDGLEITKEPSKGLYTWEKKIIPYKFERLKPSFDIDWDNYFINIHLENNPSFFMRYLINSSRLYWRKELEEYNDEGLSFEENQRNNEEYFKNNHFNIFGSRLSDDEQKDQARCLVNKIYVLGYLIHRYKIASNAKAIWAMEWKNPSEGQSNGRSGKSFFFNALEKLHICEIESMNGRNSKLTDNNFFMDRVSKSTDILLIDDIKRNSDFDTFYTMITGSMTINPKNEKSFELKYEDAPNIAFTSNFAPPNMDSSTMARLLFMAFSDYYHEMSDSTNYKENRSIRDDIGDLFEADYKEEIRNGDINFLIDCFQFYLAWRHYNMPAITPPMRELKLRQLEQAMGTPFLDWARSYFDRSGLHVDRPIVRQLAYDNYIRSIKSTKELKGKTAWKNALRMYVQFCEDLDELNPKEHPWYRADGDRLSGKCTFENKYGVYEMIYIKTKGCDDMSCETITT